MNLYEITTALASWIIITLTIMLVMYLIQDARKTKRKAKANAAMTKDEKPITMVYRYNNANPIHDMNGDCAIRAISMLLKKDWTTVYTELFRAGIKHYRTFSNEDNIRTYLRDNGYEFIPITDGKTPFKHFINPEENPILLDAKEHVAYAKGNTFYDSWDSGGQILTGYYREIKED